MVEDVLVSLEVSKMFMMLAHVVHLPQLPQLYVSNIMACLQLGSTILNYVMLKMTLFVREVVERSGSDGFWMVVELDMWTVDLDDDFDLSEYEWRETKSRR